MITHNCRLIKNRNPTNFVISVNNQDITKTSNEDDQKHPTIKHNQKRVAIGMITVAGVIYRADGF